MFTEIFLYNQTGPLQASYKAVTTLVGPVPSQKLFRDIFTSSSIVSGKLENLPHDLIPFLNCT